MAKGLPKLVELYLNRSFPGDATLKALGEHCQSLQVLDVCGYNKSTDITNVGVQALAQGCSQLEVIDLSSSIRITDVALEALAIHCNKLKSLTMRECSEDRSGYNSDCSVVQAIEKYIPSE